MARYLPATAPQLGQRVVDCGTQGPGPVWNLHQWRLYWRARLRAQHAPLDILASGSNRHAGAAARLAVIGGLSRSASHRMQSARPVDFEDLHKESPSVRRYLFTSCSSCKLLSAAPDDLAPALLFHAPDSSNVCLQPLCDHIAKAATCSSSGPCSDKRLAYASQAVHAGDDTEDEGDSAAVKKDRHAAAVAPSVLRGIGSDAKQATLHLTLPLTGTPLQVRGARTCDPCTHDPRT